MPLKKDGISRPLPDPEDQILGCLLLAVGQAFLTLVRILIWLELAYGLEVLWGGLHCCKVMHTPQACSSSRGKNLSQRGWNPRLMARKVCAVKQLLSGTHSGRKKRRLDPVNWRLIYLTCSCCMSIGFPQMADLQLISHQTEKEWRGDCQLGSWSSWLFPVDGLTDTTDQPREHSQF